MADILLGLCLHVALSSSKLSLQGRKNVLKTSSYESYGLQIPRKRQLFFAGMSLESSDLGLGHLPMDDPMSVIKRCHALSSSKPGPYGHPGVIGSTLSKRTEGTGLFPNDSQNAHQ